MSGLATSWVELVWDLAARARRYARRQAASMPLWVAPYPLALYEAILERLRASGRVEFVTATALEQGCPADRVGVYLRHDLDGRPVPLYRLVDLEVRLGIRSSFQLRVDGADYDPVSVAGPLRELRTAGFEIGLHTRAYAAVSPRATFKAEWQRFEQLLGVPPDSVSTHGFTRTTPRVLVQRLRFRWDLRRAGVRSAETPGGRHPVVAAGDSATLASGERFLGPEILGTPDASPGSWALWLTHPGYWTLDADASVRGRVEAACHPTRSR